MNKFKIIQNRESLSSQEIAKQMNFNTFISGYIPVANFLLSAKAWIIVGACSITTLIVTVMLLQSASKKIITSTEPFVVPPIPKLNILPIQLVISGNVDTVINYASGTKLFIPANAFAYNDNKPAKGPFRIQFREFQDQVDQLLSGIPMLYDSLGIKKQFESAGMFDVMGFEGDEPVYIKDGKELIVDMPTRDLRNNFNVYYLDTVQKKWNYDTDNSENNALLLAGIDTLLHKKFGAGLETMVLPGIANPLLDNLAIDFDRNEFPELSLFDSVKFQFVDKNKIKDGPKQTWEDVHIQRQNNHQYLITFTKGKQKQSFVTVPVLDKKDFDNAFTQYDKLRVIRIAKFKNISDSLNSLRNKYAVQEVSNRNVNAGINNLIHKGEFISALNEYADKESLDLISKQGALSRMVAIRRFGVYNFDGCYNVFVDEFDENGLAIKHKEVKHARYYNQSNKIELKVKFANTFVIKRNFNGIYCVGIESNNSFPANAVKESDILIIVTGYKELFFIKDEELKTCDFTKRDITFMMHKAPEGIKNAQELRKHFNM